MTTYLSKGSCGVAEYNGMHGKAEDVFKNYVRDTACGLEYQGTKYKGHAFCVFSQAVYRTESMVPLIKQLKDFVESKGLGKAYITEQNDNRAHGTNPMLAMLFAPDWGAIEKWAKKNKVLELNLLAKDSNTW